MIEIKELTCQYDTHKILDAISLHVSDHLSVLGANGSGKSTLAKALCALIDFEGSIEIDTHDITKLSSLQLAQNITYIPTKLDIHEPHMSLFEFVLLGRFPYKRSFFEYSKTDRALVQSHLKLLNITHLKEHNIRSLSSGEQQLALIAQALAQESKIIIFDEPTANLDPYNSKLIAKHIKALKASHQIILITHDLHLASYIASPILFIADTKAHYYEACEAFFNEESLQASYGVAFDDLAVRYE